MLGNDLSELQNLKCRFVGYLSYLRHFSITLEPHTQDKSAWRCASRHSNPSSLAKTSSLIREDGNIIILSYCPL